MARAGRAKTGRKVAAPPRETFVDEPIELRPATTTDSALQRWGPGLLVALAVVVAYIPSYNNEFVTWDDDHYIFDNRQLNFDDGIKSVWGDVIIHKDDKFARPGGEKDASGKHFRVSHQYYPMVFTLYWLEFRFHEWINGVDPERTIAQNMEDGKMTATSFHVVSAVMHAFNAILLIGCLRCLGAPNWVTWAAAVFFALHPMHAASVAWAAERKNIISLMFYMLSLMSYVKCRRTQHWWWYLLALVMFQAALFSKTVSLTLPITLFFTDRLLENRSRSWAAILGLVTFLLAFVALAVLVPRRPEEVGLNSATIGFACAGGVVFGTALLAVFYTWPAKLVWNSILRVAPFVLLAAIAASVTISVEDRARTIPIEDSERALVAGASIWHYVSKTLVPINLSPIYPLWDPDPSNGLWVIPILSALVIGALLIVFRKRIAPLFKWAMLYYVVIMVPMLAFKNINYFQFAFVADHYYYHGAVGIALMLALIIYYAQRKFFPADERYRVATGLVAAVGLFWGGMTWWYSEQWQDAESFWNRVLVVNPDCWPAWYNTANARLRTAIKTEDEAERDLLINEAVKRYRRVADIHGQIRQPFDQWIKARKLQRDWKGVAEAAEKGYKRFRSIEAYYNEAAIAAVRDRDPKRAIETYATGAVYFERLGDRNATRDRPKSALKHYRTSLKYCRAALKIYGQLPDWPVDERISETAQRVEEKEKQYAALAG